MGVSPVTRPGNQAGQGRPGPDIHGWRCRKTSSLPVAFLPKSFVPNKPRILPTSPMCLSAPCLSTKRQCEMKFEENPVPQRKEHLRLEKRKSPKSFRSGDLAARPAAPWSFIDKEMPGQLF